MSQEQLVARPVDGVAAHTADASWGAAGTSLLRLAEDTRGPNGEMSGDDRPGAREISNALARQTGDLPNVQGVSDFIWIWGQFLDHDLSLTEGGATVSADIPVPLGDPAFDPFFTGTAVIPFNRVTPAQDGTFHNEITAYIDASMIYGSDTETLAAMRIEGGKLVMTENAQLMLEGANFVTGDTRAAENVALSSMHTIFTREHNRLVEELSAADPSLDADALFEAARARVEGIVQAITFNDFLPLLLGPDAIAAYAGYDASVDPGISVEFSTAVYRLGHTLLSPDLQKVAEDGSSTGQLALRDAFFHPALLSEADMIEDILRGAAVQTAQALDTRIVEDVRSFLFGPPGAGGLDLVSLNIQRGRDLGVASYNDLRAALGLTRAEDFSDITSDTALAAELEAAYGEVDLVDAWIGGLAEDAVGGGMLGEMFSTVMIDQFTRLRDGDAFWSEGRAGLSAAECEAIWGTTLADVILRNTDIDAVQADVFTAMTRSTGTEGNDTLSGSAAADFIYGSDGNDTLWGQAGGDDLQGGRGNDWLEGNTGDDRLDGGAGNDRLVGGQGDDALFGGAGNDVLNGNKGDDLLSGGLGRDQMFGGDGADVLDGGTGNDVMHGNAKADHLSGGAGHDLMIGGQDNDTLLGGAGNDVLRGNGGHDTLAGGDGADEINGGQGNDTLSGGAGADVFQFHARQSGADVVLDFEAGIDTLELRAARSADVVAEVVGDDLVISSAFDWTLTLSGQGDWAFGQIEDYFV